MPKRPSGKSGATESPADNLLYASNLADEMVAACDVLNRLRWAEKLLVEPGAPFNDIMIGGALGAAVLLAHPLEDAYAPERAALLEPHDLALLGLDDVRELRRQWETEIARFARGLREKFGKMTEARRWRRRIRRAREAAEARGDKVEPLYMEAAEAMGLSDARSVRGLLTARKSAQGGVHDLDRRLLAHEIPNPYADNPTGRKPR